VGELFRRIRAWQYTTKLLAGIAVILLWRCFAVYGPPDNASEKIGKWVLRFFFQTISQPNVFWTAIASIVGIRAVFLLRDDTRATKRSVDHYVSSERGRIFLSDETFNGKNEGYMQCFAFINAGKTPITITEFETECDMVLLTNETVPEGGLHPTRYYSIVLEGGGMVGTGTKKDDSTKFHHIYGPILRSKPTMDMASTHAFLTQYHIVYRTVFGKSYRTRITVKTTIFDKVRTFHGNTEADNGEWEVPFQYRTPLRVR